VQGFAADKPAEIPCVHLDDHHSCSIHARRRTLGFPACEGFDCFGTGQWVTQHLFGGANWLDSADLAGRMFAAYRHWLPRFRAAALIEAALPYVRDDARSALAGRMAELISDESLETFIGIDEPQLRLETLRLIRAALRADVERAV
jgi:hypothetical protein